MTERAQALEAALNDFRARLEADSVELPADAARILRENLWDLYEGVPVESAPVAPAGASEPPSNMGIDWDYERSRCWSQPKVPPAPVSPVAPEPPTEMSESERLFKLAAWVRAPGNINPDDAVDECARLLENNARLLQSKPTGAPAPCAWKREGKSWTWLSGCGYQFEASFACDPTEDEMHWCGYCGHPLTVER